MKTSHKFITILALSGALSASAQLVSVAGINAVESPMPVDQTIVSPDGSCLIASTFVDNSLWKIDLHDKKSSLKLTDNGRLTRLRFSPDCKEIAYVSESINEKNLVYRQVNSMSINSMTKTLLKEPTRSVQAVKVAGDTRPVAYINYGELMLEHNGKHIALNPQGKEGQSYIWPSVSPDGKKVLYYLVGGGVFVCDINGKNPVSLGEFRAPCWYGNDLVVGMENYDDGMSFTESRILISNLKGEWQYLTYGNEIAIYPTACKQTKKIYFSTPIGELYQITLKK